MNRCHRWFYTLSFRESYYFFLIARFFLPSFLSFVFTLCPFLYPSVSSIFLSRARASSVALFIPRPLLDGEVSSWLMSLYISIVSSNPHFVSNQPRPRPPRSKVLASQIWQVRRWRGAKDQPISRLKGRNEKRRRSPLNWCVPRCWQEQDVFDEHYIMCWYYILPIFLYYFL